MNEDLVEVRVYMPRTLQSDIKDMSVVEQRSMSSQASILLSEAVSARHKRQERALRKAQQDGA